MLAVGFAGALAAWPALETDGYEARALASLGGLAAFLVAVGVAVRLAVLVPVAVGLLGVEYAVGLAIRDAPLDERAPVYAAGLLVAGELAYWSLELRSRVTDEAGAYLRRAALLSFHALLVVVVGAGLIAVVHFGGRGGLVVDAVGVAAAAAALGLVLLAARRPLNPR